ncbi:MAG: Uncharacterized protein FD153_1894 [Rhodospirillaceae bacterium]|nr:MAG: Uncharacterized protein FD153_1894 [Rhodospirillaceae bacterium]
MCCPAKSDAFRQRYASDGRVAGQWHHGVAMPSQHEGADVFRRHVEFLGEEGAEASRIEHAAHADHHVGGQAGDLAQHPHHDVQRIGDADDEGVRAVFLDAFPHRPHDLGIDADQVIAAHARLARNAGRDDYDVGTGNGGIVVGPGQFAIDILDGTGLQNVKRLPRRHTVHDVEQNDIAKLFEQD